MKRKVLLFLVAILVIDLGVLGLAGLICWLAGWRSIYEYGNVLMWAGVAVASVGVLSVFGSTRIAGDPWYHYLRSAGAGNVAERTDQMWQDIFDSWNFLILVGIAGLVAVALGWAIVAHFG